MEIHNKKTEASLLGVSFAIIATLCARGFGFVREILIANVFGTTSQGDALIIALNIPTVLVSGVALALSTIYIPTYYQINKEEKNAKKILGSINFTIFFLITVLGIVLISLVWLFPDLIVLMFASGFDIPTRDLCIALLRITIMAILPILYTGFLKAFGQIANRYAAITFVGSIVNVCLIIVLIFVKNEILNTLAIASTVGYCLYLIITVLLIISNKGFYINNNLDFRSSYLKKMSVAFVPVLISSLVTEINQMIDKNFASTLTAGTISALNYSSKLINLITAVFGTAISSVLFVKLSKLAVDGDKNKLSQSIIKVNSYLMAIIMPIFWAFFMFADIIIAFIYGRGNFDTSSVSITSECLRFYSFGIIGFNLKALWTRCYNASYDTKTPAINSSIAMIINIIMNFILIGVLKHRGLAIATVTASLVTDLLLIYKYNKKNDAFSSRLCFREYGKVTISSLAFLLIYTIVKILVDNSMLKSIIMILISTVVAGLIYMFLLVFTKSEAGIYIKNSANRLLSKRVK